MLLIVVIILYFEILDFKNLPLYRYLTYLEEVNMWGDFMTNKGSIVESRTA